MPHSANYAARWLKAAISHSSLWSDVIGGIPAVVGGLCFLLGQSGAFPTEALTVVAGWVALAGLVLVALARLLLAPSWIAEAQEGALDALRLKLGEYEEGPRFAISITSPMGLGVAEDDQEGPHTNLWFTVLLTNEGCPGSAFAWNGFIQFDGGELHRCRPGGLGADTIELTGSNTALIPRDHLIAERSIRLLARGESVSGWFFGILPLGVHEEALPREDGSFRGCKIVLQCKDYRGRNWPHTHYYTPDERIGPAQLVIAPPSLAPMRSTIAPNERKK